MPLGSGTLIAAGTGAVAKACLFSIAALNCVNKISSTCCRRAATMALFASSISMINACCSATFSAATSASVALLMSLCNATMAGIV